MSGCIRHLSSLHSPVFLLNSCLDLFSAPLLPEDPFSRSYGVSLPSSLAMNLSTPQYVLPGYLCRFAVRVPSILSLAGFLGSMITCTIGFPRKGRRTIGHQLRRWICLPPSTPKTFNVHSVCTRQCHYCVTARRYQWKSRNINRGAIGLAARRSLRTRLTPG